MSALTQTVNERLAAAVIANGGTASHLTMTTNQLLAALYNAVSAGPDLSHLTTNFDELLEATRNELSDDADETSETTEWNALLQEILTLAEGGGGGGGTPAWVTALQALAANPTDLLFAYNFTSGGTGEGWDGTNNVTLTAAQCWAATSFGTWDSANIIDGLGLQTAPPATVVGATPVGLLPASLQVSGTLLIQSNIASLPLDAPSGSFREMLFHFLNNPTDSIDGGIDQEWQDLLTTATGRDSGGSETNTETFDPAILQIRTAYNYTNDTSAYAQSSNGQAVQTQASDPNALLIDSVYVQTRSSPLIDDPTLAYIELVAVYAIQLEANLPTMSA